MTENIDRHVLAGFRCVDAITNSSVLTPLSITGTQLGLRRNNSGIFAVMDAPGVSRNTTQSLTPDPASWPAPSTYEITIQDPSLQYLPRRAKIQAPQPLPPLVPPGSPPATTTTAPTTTTTPTSTTTAPPTTTIAPTTTAQGPVPSLPPLTTPQTVVLYPSPAAPVAPNWAVLRVSVLNNATPPKALAGAVIQVSGATSPPPTGVTNSLGEALLAVPGLGLSFSAISTGPVTETTTAVTVTALFDPTAHPSGWIPNPDDILTQLTSTQWKSASQTGVQIGAGQTVFVNLTISM